jgi:hypothetical protein
LEDNCPDFPVLEEWEVDKAIRKPSAKSSPGFDKLSIPFLRKLWDHEKVRPVMLRMFNRAFRHFPKLWKFAIIRPIPKSSSPNDFRPISLLSQLSKILERAVSLRLDFLVPIRPDQFGGRASCPMEAIVYRFADHNITDSTEFGVSILFDISKAFDRVSPYLILTKLIEDEVPAWAVHFVFRFLTERFIRVVYRGEVSKWYSIIIGIPQGSPLSSILWKVAFDLPGIPTSCKVKILETLFMDDYSVSVRGKSLIDVQTFSQSILNSLWSFGSEAGFNFCPNKTYCLPMNYNSRNIRLTFGSSVLKVVWECKYLGFRFAVKSHDDFGGLSVEPQKKYELTELRRRVNWMPLLSVGKGGANFSVMRQMYISLVRSKISFCFLLKDYVDDLEKIQNRAMRLILSAMPGCPIGAMSNLLDLPDLRSLQKHHAFQVYCQLLDANIPELENSYLIASDEEKYHHSPLGWISYVHWFISSFENPDVPQMDYVQRLSRHNEFVFGATAFQIEPPSTKPSRTLWIPPPIIEDEHCF